MRIAWISAHLLANSGYGKQSREIVLRLAQLGYEIYAIGGFGTQTIYGMHIEFDTGGTPVRCLNTFGDPAGSTVFERYHRLYRFDLVISLWDFPLTQYLNRYSIPWVALGPVDAPLTRKWAEMVRNAVRVVAYSRYAYNELLRFYPPAKIRYIPHGINTEVFKPMPEVRSEVRKRMGVPEDAFLLINVSDNVPRKQLGFLLHCFRKFLDRHPGEKIYLYLHTSWSVGFPRGLDIPGLIAELGIGRHVLLPPLDPMINPLPDPELAKIYNAADVMIHTALAEGFGLPLLEAQACGVPVIAVRSSAMIELVEPTTGWLIDVIEDYVYYPHYVPTCITPDTPVITEDGAKSIKDIKVGDKVLTHTGRYKRVTKVLKRRYKGQILRVKVSYLPPIEVTPEHPVLCIRNPVKYLSLAYFKRYYFERNRYRIEWNEIQNLSKGDILLVPIPQGEVNEIDFSKYANNDDTFVIEQDMIYTRGKSPFGGVFAHLSEKITQRAIPRKMKITGDLARLLGYIIADGGIDKRHIEIAFREDQEDYVEDVITIMRRLFNIEPIIERRRNSIRIIYTHPVLAKILINMIGHYSHEKRIPKEIILASREVIAEFIKGLWRGDGCMSRTKEGYVRFTYTTTSQTLALQLFLVLAKLGILAKVTRYEGREIEIDGKKYRQKPFYQILIEGKENVEKMAKILGIKLDKVQKRDKRDGWVDDMYVYLPIKEIEIEEYDGYVYNLEVEEDESYVTSFIMHNCQYHHPPSIRSTLQRLEEAYQAWKSGEIEYLRRKCVEFAKQYDFSNIIPLWVDLLEELREEIQLLRGLA